VEEGNPIAVSNPSMDHITISPYKLGVITGASRELLQRSDPAYETMLRDQILRGIAEAVDTTFMSDLAATVGSPAGLFAGIANVAAAGTLPAAPTSAQIINYINAMKLTAMKNNMGSRNWVWVMSLDTMVGIMSLRNALDGSLFPEVAAGQLQGYPIISTTNFPLNMPVSGDRIIGLVDASEIFFGLGAGVSLSSSDVASIQYDTNPANPAINTVSAFQNELVFIRGVLDTTWSRRRDQAVLIAPTLL
jgi:HK97 family phage major capsid protein